MFNGPREMLKPRFKEKIVLPWNLIIWVPCYYNFETFRYENGYNGRILEGSIKEKIKIRWEQGIIDKSKRYDYFESGLYGYLKDSLNNRGPYDKGEKGKRLAFCRGVIKAGTPFDYGKFWNRDIVFSELVFFP